MKNALALHHSDQVHRTEPKSYTKLKGTGHRHSGRGTLRRSSSISKRKTSCQRRSNPGRSLTRRRRKERKLQTVGHQRVRAEEVQHAHSSSDDQNKGKGNGDISIANAASAKTLTAFSQTRSQQQTGQGQAHENKTIGRLVTVTKQEVA